MRLLSLVNDARCHELVPLHWMVALKLHSQVLDLVRLGLKLARLQRHELEHLKAQGFLQGRRLPQ